MRYSLAQLQGIVRQAGWPEDQIAKAAAIAKYESNGDPNALNDGSSTHTTEHSVGLFQINTLAHHGFSIAQLQDPVTNAQIGLQIWQGRPSYADWVLSNGKYNRDYLGIASQSRAIYNSGGSVPVNTDGTIIDDTIIDAMGNDEDNTALYILLGGLAAILLLT